MLGAESTPKKTQHVYSRNGYIVYVQLLLTATESEPTQTRSKLKTSHDGSTMLWSA
jgi:hypothetical protein